MSRIHRLLCQLYTLNDIIMEPNDITKSALEDAKAGKLEGPIDTSSVEAMLKSMGL